MIARLGHLALTNWQDLDGWAAAHNLPDLRRMPLGRFCSFVWYMVTRNGDQPAVEKFRTRLWMPPKGQAADPRSPWSGANQMKAFNAVRAMVQG